MGDVASRKPAGLRLVDLTSAGTEPGRHLTCQRCGDTVTVYEIGQGEKLDARRYVCCECELSTLMKEPPRAPKPSLRPSNRTRPPALEPVPFNTFPHTY